MKAEILAVGTELLMGQIANTNAQYITAGLQEKGVSVYYHTVVGDNVRRLSEMLKTCLDRSDVVIMTGGLGPTKDDLSKETVADLFGLKLILHEPSAKSIKDFFSSLNREMAPNNLKQAYMPETAEVLGNANGTAPGCIVERDGKTVILLPGPPGEMRPMFDKHVKPWLDKKSGKIIKSRYLRIFGIGESSLEVMLNDLISAQSNPTIAPYAKEGQVTLRVTAFAGSEDDADKLLEPVIGEIAGRLKDRLYSTDDEELHQVVWEKLNEKGLRLATAESCTGGLIASTIVALPGASGVFTGGVVCYDNSMKTGMLNVSEEIIAKHGAVSEQAAIEMAKGVASVTGADIGVSTTGIAGPEGGTAEKPVGLAYVGVYYRGKSYVKMLRLSGNRARIRNSVMLNAFDLLRGLLNGVSDI